MNKRMTMMMCVLLANGLGCTIGTTTGESDDSEDVTEARQEVTTIRGDAVVAIPLQVPNDWGTLTQTLYCNPGTWAYAFQQRVEPYQGSKDDTALNSVAFRCRNKVGGGDERVSSNDGQWGEWSTWHGCATAGGFINSGRLRAEPYQYSKDDTGADDAQFTCTDGTLLSAENGMPFGSWQNTSSCPVNTAVCGLSLSLEPYQGSGDDTGMDTMTLYCCSL